jgi:uncharacterized membrane protein
VNIILWLVTAILALAFLSSGVRKLIRSDEQLKALPWSRDLSPMMIRGISGLEILGVIGLILPALIGILPWLTPLAAVGLALLMLGAAGTNLRVGLYPVIAYNLVLLALSAFVAYGRFVILPF